MALKPYSTLHNSWVEITSPIKDVANTVIALDGFAWEDPMKPLLALRSRDTNIVIHLFLLSAYLCANHSLYKRKNYRGKKDILTWMDRHRMFLVCLISYCALKYHKIPAVLPSCQQTDESESGTFVLSMLPRKQMQNVFIIISYWKEKITPRNEPLNLFP